MVSRFVPFLAGVAMVATVGPAFAFDAMVSAPTALRTHASRRAAVIEVIPARAIIDMERCVHGWCEATYAGQVGFVYTPVLVSAAPVSPTDEGPLGVLTAPLTLPFTAAGAVLGGAAESPGPVVAAY
ncbi:MAG TPA: hypothetical protein VIF61_01100 [Methylocystis sp.]